MHEAGVTEAGWFYVEGDPPGTVRRWNGHEWIGVPILAPTESVAMHGAKPHQVRAFDSRDQLLSVLTVVMLAGLAVLFVFATIEMFHGADELSSTSPSEVVQLRDLGRYFDNIEALSFALALAMLLTALVFIPWVKTAASTAQISRYKGGAYTTKARQPGILLIGVGLLFFGPVLIAIFVLRIAMNDSGRASVRNRGLFGVVMDTAMASSTDPKTGVAQITPVKIVAWWALWWGPAIIATLAAVALWILSPIDVNVALAIIQLNALLLALEVISLLCIIATVIQISMRLTR